jgi:undecaprenyl-diphosphatase
VSASIRTGGAANDRPHARADRPPSTRTVVVAVGLIAVAISVFLLIAQDVLDGGGVVSHDEAVLAWFVDHRSAGLIRAAKLISTIGGFVGLAVAGVALVVWLGLRGYRTVLLAAPLLALTLASLVSTAAKSYFGRDRPPAAVHATAVKLDAFPSGHAADAAAFFLAAALVLALTVAATRRSQFLYITTGALFAGLVGVSRLVLAVHWLSDVIAGWALGSAIATAVLITVWATLTRKSRTPTTTPAPEKR